MRDPGSIPTGGNILSLDFFHVVKPPMPILPLLPILSIWEKPDCDERHRVTNFLYFLFIFNFEAM